MTHEPQAPIAPGADGAPTEITVAATYQDGIIRPDSPLDLPASARLVLRIVPEPVAPEPQAETNGSTAPAIPPAEVLPAPEPAALRLGEADATSAVPPHPVLLVLFGTAVGLGGLAHYLFLQSGDFSWTALLLYGLAVVLFALAIVGRNHPLLQAPLASDAATLPAGSGPSAQAASQLLPTLLAAAGRHGLRLAALAGSLLLTVLVLYVLQISPPLEDYTWTLLPWIGAMLLYVAAIAPWRRPNVAELRDWRGHLGRLRSRLQALLPGPRWWLQPRWQVAGLLGAILLVALGVRLWDVSNIPPTLGGDEGSQGLDAIKVLEGEITNPFSTGWLGVPTLSFYFKALSIGALGNTIFALRLPWVLVGTASVLILFLLVRRLAGLTVALVTAALFATYHYHIHFSRLGSVQVADILFVTLMLLFIYRGYDSRRPLEWAFAGIAIGIAQFFYAGARFTIILAAAVVLFLGIRDGLPFLRQRYREVLILVGAGLIAGAPMIQFAFRFPNEYDARVNMVGIIQSGWLEREQEVRNESAFAILFDQAKRSALAFNFYPDRNVWYGSPRPLMNYAEAALFVLGFGYGLLHIFDRRIYPMIAWWGGAMVLGGMLTESAPSSQRLITMAAPAIFFVALALVRVGQTVLKALDIRRPAPFLLPYLTAAVLVLSAISIQWYFHEFTPMLRYGGYNGVVATSLGKYARDELGPDWRIYFFGPPRMYVGFSTIPYLAPDVPREDVPNRLTAPPPPEFVVPDQHAAFVFLPERQAELGLVRRTFPNGTEQAMPSPVPGQEQMPLYIVYLVPRSQFGAGG